MISNLLRTIGRYRPYNTLLYYSKYDFCCCVSRGRFSSLKIKYEEKKKILFKEGKLFSEKGTG